MTKKHFVALADVLRKLEPPKHSPLITRLPDEYRLSGEHAQHIRTINAIADFCQSQNSQFNRQRWLDYIAGICGPNGGVR